VRGVQVRAPVFIYSLDRDECKVLSICIDQRSACCDAQSGGLSCGLQLSFRNGMIAAQAYGPQGSRRVRNGEYRLEILLAACGLFPNQLLIDIAGPGFLTGCSFRQTSESLPELIG
jgi:hypothetical protein